MTIQTLTGSFCHSVSGLVSTGWKKAQSFVGVKEDASTTEKVIRVYNATVAALVFAGWTYEIGHSFMELDSSSGMYESVWKTAMIFLATGEYLSDVAFHIVSSQISEDSPTELKVIATALDTIRLGIIGKLQLTEPPLSTIPSFLNYTDILNHLGNISYNTGLLKKITGIFSANKEKVHNE